MTTSKTKRRQPNLWEITREERIAAAKRSRPSTLRANRIAAGLFAEQQEEAAIAEFLGPVDENDN